jgi:hypothetical protein
MTRNGDGSTVPDRDDLLARAREAQHRAELLIDRARESAIQATITSFRSELIPLSPVVQARLHLHLVLGPASTVSDGRARRDLSTAGSAVVPGRSGPDTLSELDHDLLQQSLRRRGSSPEE